MLWRCWQDGVAYDPARHAGLQNLSPVADPEGTVEGELLSVGS